MKHYQGWALPGEDRHFQRFLQQHPDNDYQQQALDLALTYCPRRELVLDVGANIGLFATRFSRIFERVVCFEPTTAVYDCLRLNCRDLDNVEIFKLGLGQQPSLTTISAPADLHNIGVYSMRDFVSSDQLLVHETVPVVPLDQFQLRPDLIKIDTQGFEPFVLSGALETLITATPVLLLEVESPSIRSELHRLLVPLGYQAVAAVRHDQVWINVCIDACASNTDQIPDLGNSNEIERCGAATDRDQKWVGFRCLQDLH